MRIGTSVRNEEQGFTLIELLVVVLIIGVLAAIAVPAFMNQRVKANDSTLQTDIRNVAMTLRTWQLDKGNNNERYSQLVNGRLSSYVEHPEGVNNANTNYVRWHDVPELPDSPMSPGSVVSVIVVTEDNKGDSWSRPHDEGEFCLVGSLRNSTWDYVHSSGEGAKEYNRLLYYDVKLGGIKTLDEVVSASVTNGDENDASCYGHAKMHHAALTAPPEE